MFNIIATHKILIEGKTTNISNKIGKTCSETYKIQKIFSSIFNTVSYNILQNRQPFE